MSGSVHKTRQAVELSVVVPVFEEEAGIPLFMERIVPVLDVVAPDYEIIFCVDPGRDQTETVIRTAISNNARVRMIVFTRRFGQPSATVAGIEACHGMACVVMDVDLQDSPELIREMVAKWKEGFNVVYAQRRTRAGETIFRRAGAYMWYWLVNKISDVPIPRNTGDFRLMDRKVIEALRGLRETHCFLRGLVPYVGFKQTPVLFDREVRLSGRSKYSQIIGSLKIAFNGIVAFSSKPLALASLLGFGMAGFGFLMAVYYFLQKLIFDRNITPGLSSTIIVVTLFSGVQLICLGILGEYIARIYDEVRGRPRYLIASKENFFEES